jgi:hypothetical protein
MRKLLFAVIALAATSAAAQTQNVGVRDVMQARNLGMGGAYRALGLGAEAIVGNPATMPLYKRYHIELGGMWDAKNKDTVGSVGILDSSTSVMAAGLSYNYTSRGRGVAKRVTHFTTLGLGVPLGDMVNVGISARHVLGGGAARGNAITGDAGIAVRLADPVIIAVGGHNLIAIPNPDAKRFYSAGVGLVTGTLAGAVDVQSNLGEGGPTEFAFNVGGEYILGNMFPVRAGYALDNLAKAQYVSTGVGVFYEGGGVDLGYRHELGGRLARTLALTLRIQN